MEETGPSPLQEKYPMIKRVFGLLETDAYLPEDDTVENIISRLKLWNEEFGDEHSANALRAIQSSSPLSLKITHRHLRDVKARNLSLKETLKQDYRIVTRMIRPGEDFYEGVRATLIHKVKKYNFLSLFIRIHVIHNNLF